ncbi:MAG: toll/interleukin-1 receptor domain-containing protein [Anaerolineales bacterium]|nr:toll/interleukin-1 receptor domain-containing protein [Anaerolineales bacterium]
MKKPVKIFVSYAHANQELTNRFVAQFKEFTRPSKAYLYHIWRDTDLLVGENWDDEIKQALKKCDFGLLLISASFLGSKYITSVELELLKTKSIIPVLLWPVDFNRHDLRGLEEKQIFRLHKKGFQRPKSYGECTTKQRVEFILALFQQVEKRLDKITL